MPGHFHVTSRSSESRRHDARSSDRVVGTALNGSSPHLKAYAAPPHISQERAERILASSNISFRRLRISFGISSGAVNAQDAVAPRHPDNTDRDSRFISQRLEAAGISLDDLAPTLPQSSRAATDSSRESSNRD